MFTEAITIIAEYVANLGLDAIKDRFKERINEIKLRSSLIDYLEHQRKYNEMRINFL